MRIVIDTGVFYRPAVLDALARSPHPIIVPVVALAERLRQLKRDGGDMAAFRRTLIRASVTIEPLDEPSALRHSLDLDTGAEWRKLSHDAFIAGHVQPDDELWTTNPNDFVALGVPADRIVTVS